MRLGLHHQLRHPLAGAHHVSGAHRFIGGDQRHLPHTKDAGGLTHHELSTLLASPASGLSSTRCTLLYATAWKTTSTAEHNC
jgi:hypothetical protein